jgi:hypothetical protein
MIGANLLFPFLVLGVDIHKLFTLHWCEEWGTPCCPAWGQAGLRG